MLGYLFLPFQGFIASFLLCIASLKVIYAFSHCALELGPKKMRGVSITYALIDLIYAFGAGLILYFSDLFEVKPKTIAIYGSLVLFIKAVMIYKMHPFSEYEKDVEPQVGIKGYLLKFPFRFLLYAAFFGVLDVHFPDFFIPQMALLLLGTFLGAYLFWHLLTLFMHKIRHELSARQLYHLQRLGAFIYATFCLIGILFIYLYN